ncbi:MAG: type II secretion system F family protein [Thaumarchaeota archaeon]|nr:type II secretion system F family protein [Nitrososphaerota archaeon]
MKLRELHSRRLLMYAVTGACAAAAAGALVVAGDVFGVPLPFPVVTMAILAAIGCFVFPGLAERSYNRWRTKIDDNIPNMLADIAANVRSGFNITRSLELAADTDYGPLTEQLKIDKIQLSWGRTFTQVMRDQEKRVDSQLAKRTFASLAQASVSGATTQDVLDAIQRHTTELHQIDKETKNALRPYIATIYIAVGIFLAISVVLIDTFFTQIFASQAKVGQGASIFAGLGGLNIKALKQAFLQMGLMESVFGGLGAGKLGEASFAAGFKHVIILAVLNIVVFTIFVS